jgi:pimeloyl-ACP methyl ester carboxylesterase
MLGYRIEGNGPPLLLIHGWGVSYNIWKNLLPLLTPHCQVVMVELPGINGTPWPEPALPYNDSAAEAIEAVRRALGIEHWSVLSYSAGTRVGEAYVRHDAAHVDHAIFLCPVRLTRLRAGGLRLGKWVNDRWPLAVNWMVSGWRLHFLVWLLGFNGRPHPIVAEWVREIGSQPKQVLKTTLLAFPGFGRAPFDLPGLPTLFLWGRWDVIAVPPRRLCPNDRLLPAGHSAPVLAAESVAGAVVPFLKPTPD